MHATPFSVKKVEEVGGEKRKLPFSPPLPTNSRGNSCYASDDVLTCYHA